MANDTVDINALRTLIEKLATDDAFRAVLAKKPAEVLSGMCFTVSPQTCRRS